MNKTKEVNTGIFLLRILMCLGVIQDHFPIKSSGIISQIIIMAGSCAVPCFMFISFYLTAHIFIENKVEALIVRIKRLIYPLILWTIAYFIFHNLYSLVVGAGGVNWRHVFYSALFGSSAFLNSPMWFLSTQVILAIIFFMLMQFADRFFMRVALFIGSIVVAFIFQYGGMNSYLFGACPFESRYPLGRILETLPVSAVGLLYGIYKNRISLKHNILIIVICTFLTIITNGIYLTEGEGFGYQGLPLFFKSIAISTLFINLPHISNKNSYHIIKKISEYTMGIYCMHLGIGQMLEIISQIFRVNLFQGSVVFVVIIFFLGWVLSALLDTLFGRIRWIKYMVK